MNNPIKDFIASAKELSRNPLGIIALFIGLVYGIACLLFGLSVRQLTSDERYPLILFVIVFPVLVLMLFAWLVAKHHDKLYAPSDFRSDEAFLQTFIYRRKLQDNKFLETKGSEKDITDLMNYGKEFSIISEQEKNIEEDLKKRNLDFSRNAAKVLIHQLAASQVLNWFAEVYHTLFGSQISLLKIIERETSGISYAFALEYFEKLKSAYPKILELWSIDKYLNYPIIAKLIVQKDKKIAITKIGKEFLEWLRKSQYADDKPL